MPDTMLPQTTTQVPAAPCGVLSDYRSPLIGQLVAARAKASGEIRRIVKDKKAEIPNKNGGRGYVYAYADLASVMDAVDDALAAQELALFQTTVDRKGTVFLVTTLAHSSDQWIASEIRVGGLDAGPQVFGSALTYMRRYSALSILGIAPDSDDDGRAAQDRADQQARQKPVQQPEAISHAKRPRQKRRPLSRLLTTLTSRSTYRSKSATAGRSMENGPSWPWKLCTANLKHGGGTGWSCTRLSWPK
jgi:hypothetical protein